MNLHRYFVPAEQGWHRAEPFSAGEGLGVGNGGETLSWALGQMDTPDHLAPCSAYKSGVMVWVLPRNSSMWGPALPEVAEHTCCTQEELMPLFALLASVAFAFTIKISLIRPRSFYPWDPVPSPAWWGVRERLCGFGSWLRPNHSTGLRVVFYSSENNSSALNIRGPESVPPW